MSTPLTPPARVATPRRLELLFPAALVLLEFLLYLSQDMVLPALPQMATTQGVDATAAQLTITAWLVGAAAMQLPIGPLSDRYGRRVVLLSGGALFVASCAGCALAPGYALFMLCRVLQGATIACVIVAGYASIHETLDARRAIRTQAWMSSVTVIAPGAGPLLGAAVLTLAHWPAIFVLLALGGLTASAALYRWAPETVDRARSAPLSLHAVLQVYRRLLREPRVTAPLAAVGLLIGMMIGWSVAGPFILQHRFGTMHAFAVAQAYLFSTYIVGTWVLRRRAARLDPHTLVARALPPMLAGGALAWIAALLGAPAVVVLALFGLCTFGIGHAVSPLTRLVLENTPSHTMGAGVALVSLSINLCGIATTLGVAELRLDALPQYFMLAAAMLVAVGLLCSGIAPGPSPD